MSHTTYYVQECPTCGRRLQIRVAYLGRRLFCQHCNGPFYASDPTMTPSAPYPVQSRLLERAERLLAAAEKQKLAPPVRSEFLGDEMPVQF